MITALAAVMAPTVMFGVPERPVAFPVTFPVTLPVRFPTKLVAVTTPLLIVTVVPTFNVVNVDTPVEFISPLTLPSILVAVTTPTLIVP